MSWRGILPDCRVEVTLNVEQRVLKKGYGGEKWSLDLWLWVTSIGVKNVDRQKIWILGRTLLKRNSCFILALAGRMTKCWLGSHELHVVLDDLWLVFEIWSYEEGCFDWFHKWFCSLCMVYIKLIIYFLRNEKDWLQFVIESFWVSGGRIYMKKLVKN